jgi:hypothetical protein
VVRTATVGGTKRAVKLRTKIESLARLHLIRDEAMRSQPTQMALLKRLTVLREDARRLGDRIVESRAFWAEYNGYAPEKDMIAATDAYFEKLLRNLDGVIAALGPPLRKTGGAASRKQSRDLFWEELLSMWCELGGRPTGAHAADFLTVVSDAVLPRGSGSRPSTLQWLRRRSLRG